MGSANTRIVALTLALAFAACSGGSEVEQPVIIDSRYISEAETAEVVELLSHESPYIRMMAAAELGYNRRDYSAIPALIAALGRESDPDVSLRVATVLSVFRDQDAIDAVVEHWLSDAFPQHRSELLSGLYGANPCLVEPAMATHGHLDPTRPIPVRQACPSPPDE